METVKKSPQVMRHELPQGMSVVEVQVSLMETSQNTIFFPNLCEFKGNIFYFQTLLPPTPSDDNKHCCLFVLYLVTGPDSAIILLIILILSDGQTVEHTEVCSAFLL